MTLEEIEKLSLTEIKAMVYDEMVKAETAQKNIQLLNQIIAKKSQSTTEPQKEDVVPGKGE